MRKRILREVNAISGVCACYQETVPWGFCFLPSRAFVSWAHRRAFKLLLIVGLDIG